MYTLGLNFNGAEIHMHVSTTQSNIDRMLKQQLWLMFFLLVHKLTQNFLLVKPFSFHHAYLGNWHRYDTCLGSVCVHFTLQMPKLPNLPQPGNFVKGWTSGCGVGPRRCPAGGKVFAYFCVWRLSVEQKFTTESGFPWPFPSLGVPGIWVGVKNDHKYKWSWSCFFIPQQ